MIFGTIKQGPGTVELATDVKRVSQFACPSAGYLSKLTAWVDGAGSGVGDQFIRGVVYDTATNALVASGDPVTIADGRAGGWVDLPFPQPPVALTAQTYWLGVQANGVSLTTRLSRFPEYGAGGKFGSDAWTDGPANPFGASTATVEQLAVYATVAPPYAPPDVDDEYLATLGFPCSQAILSGAAPLGNPVPTVTTWHGTALDPARGAFVVAGVGTSAEELVGERLQLTYERRTVVVVVHELAELQPGEQLSVTRRAFLALAPLASNPILVDMQVLG